MENQESRRIIYIVVGIVVVIGILFSVTYLFRNNDGGEAVQEVKAEITSFLVERPYFVITSQELSSVSVYGVPTGTDVSEKSHLLLGESNQFVDGTEGQIWNVAIPTDQILLSHIYVVGTGVDSAITERFYFPLSGATDIYNALWLDTPSSVEELSVGQEIIVNDIQVRLLSVADNRCPEGVQCVTAGEVRATVEITGQGKKESMVIGTVTDKTVSSHGYSFSIQDVAPQAKAGEVIEQTDYRITLVIEQENKG